MRFLIAFSPASLSLVRNKSALPLRQPPHLMGDQAVQHLTLDFYQLFKEVATDCDLDKSTVQYCLKRLRAEGLKFWTITLPKLAKCVLYSIEMGTFLHRTGPLEEDALTCFAWKGRSLRYFRSLLGKIFCLQTGALLPAPSAVALRSLRQLCEYVYKLNLAFDSPAKIKAEEKYEANENAVAQLRLSHAWLDALRVNAEKFYPRFAKGQVHDILAYGPRFGPGSFELSGSAKSASERANLPFYIWRNLPDHVIGSCDRKFKGHSGYFKPYRKAPVPVKLVDEGRTAKVLFVPKDSRGPRVISKEPLHIIKPQMAFLSYAVSALEADTNGRINFLDQSVNRGLAQQGSLDRKVSTFDLKDASDMVSYRIAAYISQFMPGVRWFLKNSRSTHYKLPSGRSGQQFALAGMGSGLTFPFLALIIHLSVCTHISSMCELPYKDVSSRVYVYGDDLVVPTEWACYVQTALSKSGLRLNTSKCYVKGPFRESCGGDYLLGIECSPIRLKMTNCCLPSDLGGRGLVVSSSMLVDERGRNRFDNMVLSLDRHAKEMRKAGWFNAASYIEGRLEKVVPMPYVGEGSPVIGKLTDDDRLVAGQGGQLVSFDNQLQLNKVKVAIPTPVEVDTRFKAPVDGISELGCPYKFLSKLLKQLQQRDVTYELGNSSGQAFGVYSEPRISKLTYQTALTNMLANRFIPEIVIDLRSKKRWLGLLRDEQKFAWLM